MNIISSLTVIDRLVKKNELGQPFTLMDNQREVLRLAFAFDENGVMPWDTILYSCIKKSGKTTLNGAMTLGWGFTQEAPNEILILANDLEQTLAHVFKTMEGIIQHNPELQREAEVQTKTIYLANGTSASIFSLNTSRWKARLTGASKRQLGFMPRQTPSMHIGLTARPNSSTNFLTRRGSTFLIVSQKLKRQSLRRSLRPRDSREPGLRATTARLRLDALHTLLSQKCFAF